MSIRSIGHTVRASAALMILLSLLAACGKAEPSATPIPPTLLVQDEAATLTPPPPSPTQTPAPPTETATPTPVATLVPTATATPAPTATETPAPAPYPELDARADARTYGGELNDLGYDILFLDDGGTLIVGQANNTGPSHRISPGTARLIRTDAEGNVVWEKDYGGEVDSMFYSPIQTGEDEYVILGQIAASYDRDEDDMYLVKIDGEGNEIWSRTYGGRGMDHGKMVRQTADGGYILVGDRADEFPSGGLYQSDIVLIKTDAEGNEVWTRTYGDEILYIGWGVEQTPDGGYVLIGWEAKTIPDRDVIAIKTDEMGEVEWSRTWDLDPGDRDGGFDMILSSDGHVVIAGIQSMDDGPRGAVLIKVDLDGNEIWTKVFGSGGVGNEFWDIMEDADGGYVMAGDTFLSYNPRTGEAVRDGLIIKTDPDGEVLWQHAFNGSAYESVILSSAVVLPGRGYIFIGSATPSDAEHWDMLRLKLTTDDDQAIAFTSERDGNSEIYVMNADGSHPRRLTNDPAYDAWPTWSPDGSQIAFMSNRSGNPDIYVMEADGSNVRQLTHHSANDIWPEWSPDGTRIVFPSRRDGNFEIYVVNVQDALQSTDGTNLQRLTNTPSHEDFPAWSPDGSRIVFSRVEGDDGTYVMNVDGAAQGSRDEQKLLDFRVFEPAWSPDGTRIAFASDHEGFRCIYVMDVTDESTDGSNLQKLSSVHSGENCPTWSPDGTRIAFTSWRDGDGEIYVMDVKGALRSEGTDGGDLQKLTDNRFEEEFPAWRPAPTQPPASPPALSGTQTRPADGMVMVYVPAGEFQMGSDDAEVDLALEMCNTYYGNCKREWFEVEQPAHTVALDGFWMDRTEVTNAQYRRCVEAEVCNPPLRPGSDTRRTYYDDDTYDDYPVIHVNWLQAEAYCEWAGGQLPTEAQWEYAARGPEGRRYPWGDEYDGTRLNACDVNCRYAWAEAAFDDGHADTAPVGSYADGASWCGALDMAGNVYEWMGDWYGEYTAGHQVNPTGPPSGASHPVRGDAADGTRSVSRTAARHGMSASRIYKYLGFRCVVPAGE